MNDNDGKKAYSKPEVTKLGGVSDFVQQNDLSGDFDNSVDVIVGGIGFSCRQS